jgi:addiction module RelE/StbE family toxin
MEKIIWSELALDDLKSIHDYISKDSIIYANRVIEKIIQRIDQLEHFPKSGRVVPELNNNSIRELIQNNYRIIYKVTTQEIFIVSIHHASKLME